MINEIEGTPIPQPAEPVPKPSFEYLPNARNTPNQTSTFDNRPTPNTNQSKRETPSKKIIINIWNE